MTTDNKQPVNEFRDTRCFMIDQSYQAFIHENLMARFKI